MWKGWKTDTIYSQVLNSAEKIANAFNLMSGLELISRTELATAGKWSAGKSPQGTWSQQWSVWREFKLFCDRPYLFFIQQINCETINRGPACFYGCETLNDKRKSESWSLSARQISSDASNFITVETGLFQSRQTWVYSFVKWLTFQAQTLNYERWEETAVELGARLQWRGDGWSTHHFEGPS
jgi:hypothetical protein